MAMLLPTKKKLTPDEFYDLYASRDDVKAELVNGEVIEMCPAGEEHGALSMDVTVAMANFAKEHGLGRVYSSDTGFILDEAAGIVRAPHVAFVAKARLAGRRLAVKYAPVAPDLAVEVVSPSDTAEDIETKI